MSSPHVAEAKCLSTSKAVFEHLKEFMKDFEQDREYIVLIGLNTRYNMVYCNIEAIGGMDSVSIEPTLLFKRLIVNNCKYFIIAHNHPSNNTAPSDADIAFTKRVYKCGEILGVKLLDHVVYSSDFSGYETINNFDY